MKKFVGYGYKIEGESVESAIDNLYGGVEGLHPTRRVVREEVKRDLSRKVITKRDKPKIFKLIIEFQK